MWQGVSLLCLFMLGEIMKRRVFVEQWWHSENSLLIAPKAPLRRSCSKWVETNVPVEELEFQPNAPGEIDWWPL